ncbi:16S rRNA (cytosine(967)-C(5))-methyltransferase RsmB [Alteromonas aestuariivivens]|uniref:16S rRNA (cytosine(967)-C(5))-methyltransferase n=1 Tax=Alteromonas aestuariivivens TaxID=1938339 RepID=A0A3D8M4T6_9ALTE|nr:16S rRNA (cytosine(967)-C(5))-methyltransferase RsmB [Alteromonas aestuariivivens]RDV24757.1 16S rRNA (cytosine(967)-C(5))-methyltransferase RsmB [Alteromonas aestuariivivens]
MSDTPLPRQKNLRADSAWILYQILECGRSSRDCLAQVQRRHGPRDNAWIQEMTMGVLRRLPVLQYWLRQLLDKPLKGKKKILEHLILLGFYQIAFSRVSPHAAVGETVNAAPYLGGVSLKGLVNAVLRNFQRSEIHLQPLNDELLNSGLPKWLYKQILACYNEQTAEIVEQTNSVAPIWLRVNRRQLSREEFTAALEQQGLTYQIPEHHPDAVLLTSRGDVQALPGFAKGWFAVQDGAAQLAAHYLAPGAGERILDCCAAPGGKTGHIMELQPALGACIALDSDEHRLKRVTENMQRLGHQPTVLHGDAGQPTAWWDGKPFDRILLDAPCSATGVIRRHADIRWLRNAKDIEQLVAIQQTLLETLWPLLKSGGTLLYATCSILPQENRQQISQFLARHNDAQLDPILPEETPEKPGRQILPGEQQMDGFYYARLVKS